MTFAGKSITIPGVDSRSLSLFRIALGLGLLADMFFYKLPYFSFFYSQQAVLENSTLSALSPSLKCSLLYYLNNNWQVWGIIIVAIAGYLCIVIGYNTKWAAILAFICLFSMHERNILFHIGGSDDILRLSLFWSIFLPLDKHYTILRKNNKANCFPIEVKSLAIYALLLQIGSIYFFNFLAKSGNTWSDGTAVSYALMISSLRGVWSNWLLTHLLICQILTYMVKGLSLAVLFLILSPFYNKYTRIAAAIFIFCFHWGLIPFLNVQHFCISTLPFIFLLMPSGVWDWLTFKSNNNHHLIKALTPKIKHKKAFHPNWHEKLIIGFVALAMLLSLSINLSEIGSIKRSLWSKFLNEKACNCGGLGQKWGMFAPDPAKEYGILYTVGILDDNKMINLFNGTDFSETKATDDILNGYNLLPLSFIYVNYYLPQITVKTQYGQEFWKRWISYWRNTWQQGHPEVHFRSVVVIYISTKSEAPGVYSKPHSRFIAGVQVH